eukprot:TRINITY_DN8328_c1_g2_i1.p1 TRINITY_DN8328_c1_g2~~TRINITY_DN8328_c1_g2_i1.p1  ORF type:complete len:363 (+),score=93.91 TRINITY_DN8328_c1_g2_i1:160-1248(+)
MKGIEVVSISCAFYFSLIYCSNGDLFGMGSSLYLKSKNKKFEEQFVLKPTILLNDQEIKSICCGQDYSVILKNDGKVLRNFDEEIENNIKMISSGWNFFLMYSNEEKIYGYGSNNRNQLGKIEINVQTTKSFYSFDVPNVKLMECGAYFALIYKENGDLMGWGDNNYGQLGLGNDLKINQKITKPKLITNNKNIKQISCGYYHSMYLTFQGEMFAFGYNSYGMLGIGNNKNQMTPVKLETKEKIKYISAFAQSSMFYTENGDIFSFGQNNYGQLGLSKTKYDTPQKAMNNPNLTIINSRSKKQFSLWSPEKHSHFSSLFKQNISTFVKCLKFKQSVWKLKLPKFVLFEIIIFFSAPPLIYSK